MEDLIKENKKLKKQINLLKKRQTFNIDKIFEEWYSNYKREDFNIFSIELPVIGKIDLLPEVIEKHIYKNMIHISLFMISKVKIDMMGINMSFNFN